MSKGYFDRVEGIARTVRLVALMLGNNDRVEVPALSNLVAKYTPKYFLMQGEGYRDKAESVKVEVYKTKTSKTAKKFPNEIEIYVILTIDGEQEYLTVDDFAEIIATIAGAEEFKRTA